MKRHSRGIFPLILLLLLTVLLADSRFRLVTTEYLLGFDNLPPEFDGFRVVQLSDVHGAVYGKENARLLRAVEKAKPDLIAITGDLADKNTDLTELDTLLAGLAELAPVWYVSGNHEWSEKLLGQLAPLLERRGIRRLANDYILLERDGGHIVLAGVDDPNGPWDMETPDALAARLRTEYPTEFVLLLGHRNDWTEKYPELPVDLVLCGHAHGGVIRIPGVGGLLGTGRVLFPKHTAGIFAAETYRMLVSRGLGGSTAGIPRFCNNPEIVAVTLKTN